MADEEDHESDTSDSTVLLEDFINKPKKVDAKRRRISNLKDNLISIEYEDQGTAADITGPSEDMDGSSNNQNNFDDEVICIDSDKETQEKENNVSTSTDFKLNYRKYNIFEHAKLKVLEPSRINARRATTNIFEKSEEQMNSLLGVGEKKQKRNNIFKASSINARRATTGFEGSSDTNSISNKSMQQNSEVKNINDVFCANANKRIRNRDETPGDTKRIKINTDLKLHGKCEEITKNADKRQETNENHAERIFLKPSKTKMSQLLDKQVLSQSQGKIVRQEEFVQGEGNLQDMQEIGEAGDNRDTNKCNDKHNLCQIPNENKLCTKRDASVCNGQGRSELHCKDETVDVQDNQGINQTPMSELEVRNDQEIRETLEVKIPNKRKENEESKNLQEEQIASNVLTAQEIEKLDSQNAKQGAKTVADKRGDDQKIIDVRREKIEKKETHQKFITVHKGRILKFQVGFFTFVKDCIVKKLYPQSAIFLQNLIHNLITDAKAGKVLTDITLNCPQCNHTSTYSANILNDTGNNDNIPKADESQKCGLCKVVAKLHTTYLNRYLQEAAAKIKMSKSMKDHLTTIVTNSQQECKLNSSAFSSASPINDLAKKRKINEYTNDTKCRKIGNEQDIDQKDNLTHTGTSLSKDDIAVSNSDSNLKTDIHSKDIVLPINNQTNKNDLVPDGHTTKVVILSIQDVTPGRIMSVHKNKEYSGSVERNSSNISQGEREVLMTKKIAKVSEVVFPQAIPIDERTDEMQKMSPITSCSTINTLGLTVPENIDKDMSSKNAPNTSDDKEIRIGSQRKDISKEVEENNGNNKSCKSADSTLPHATSERSVGEEKLNADTQRPESEKKSTVNVTEKTLEKLYINLKNKPDDKDKDDQEVETKHTSNTATLIPVKSKKCRTGKIDAQPCITKKRKRDQYTCPTCTCTYSYPSKLLSHMREKHRLNLSKIPDECIKRHCVFCNNVFPKKQYNNHVKKHHNEMFTKIVSVNDTTRNNIHIKTKSKIHNQRHPSDNEGNKASKTPQYQYHCSICDEILSTEATATQHTKQKHPNFGRLEIFNKVMIEVSDTNVTNAYDASNDDKSDKSSVENNTHDQSSVHRDHNPNNISTEITTNRNEPDSLKEIPNAKDDAKETGSDKYDQAGDSGDNTNHVSALGSSSNQTKSSDETAYDNKLRCNKQNSTNGIHTTNITRENETMQGNKKCEPSNSITDVKVRDLKDQEDTCNAMKNSKHVSYCLLCKEIFTVSAKRKHREEKHPGFRGIALFKNIASNPLIEPNPNKKQSGQFAENRTLISSDGSKKIEENTDNIDSNIHIENYFTSGDEVLKASASAIKNKKDRVTKLFGEDNSPTLQNEGNLYSNNHIEKDFDSGDEVLKLSTNAIKNKKERITKLFGEDNSPTFQSESNINSNNHIAKDFTSENELDKSPASSLKNKKGHIRKPFGEDDNPTMQNNNNVKPNVNEAKNNIEQITEANETNIVSKPNIVAEENPVKDDTAKKIRHMTEDKEKHVTTFTEHRPTVIDKTNDGYDQKLKNIQNVDEFHTVSPGAENSKREGLNNNGTQNVIREAVAMEVDPQLIDNNAQENQINCDQQAATTGNLKTDVKNVEHIGNNNACSNKTDLQNSNTDQYRKEFEGASDKTIDPNGIMYENDVLNNFHDDDRAEIDQINRLLESYEEARIVTSNVENTKQIEKPDAANDDPEPNNSLSLSVEAKNCLESIKITNVTSIADKINIYVCQECQYATDDYDNAIRHCQNHYNEIADAVTYCRVCELSYDVSCFDKHEISHDKYLKSVKIKFSHTWLFSNWQAVFNDMPLSHVEDIQMKSIYKSFCVKMSVKEGGAWQTSLYQCGACNTCVPPHEIEGHVKGKCYSMNYLCRVCERTFLTNEMRNHHEIYHERDEAKSFKIIVFNGLNDKDFNFKLLKAKEQKRIEKQQLKKQIVDIVKCSCELCFLSWDKFKFHFVECTNKPNNGTECPKCIVKLKFLKDDLSDHLSHHDGAFEFKVCKITFTKEIVTNANSKHDTPSNISVTNVCDDIEIKKEMMKDEVLSQCTQNTEFDFDDKDLEVKKELLKNDVNSHEATEDFDELNLHIEDFDSDVEFIE